MGDDRNISPDSGEEFVSELITPLAGTGDAVSMSRGEPGLPLRFVWRDRTYRIATVLRNWKSSSPEGGTGRLYLRRHWYRIETEDGQIMTIYFERQARQLARPKARWWLYSLHHKGEPGQ